MYGVLQTRKLERARLNAVKSHTKENEFHSEVNGWFFEESQGITQSNVWCRKGTGGRQAGSTSDEKTAAIVRGVTIKQGSGWLHLSQSVSPVGNFNKFC